MLTTDRDALICDMAETYHVYDLRALPLSTISVLACGLRDDSRIVQKLSGQKISTNTLLTASIRDSVAWLVWANSKKGSEKPEWILPKLLGTEKPNSSDVIIFDGPEDFEKARQQILGGD